MTILRVIGVIGLVLLAALALVLIGLSIKGNDFWGVFMGLGFMALLAFFADTLRVEAAKQLNPAATTRPSRRIFYGVLLFGGVLMSVSGINGLLQAQWWTAAKHLLLAFIVLAAVIGELYLGYRNRT